MAVGKIVALGGGSLTIVLLIYHEKKDKRENAYLAFTSCTNIALL